MKASAFLFPSIPIYVDLFTVYGIFTASIGLETVRNKQTTFCSPGAEQSVGVRSSRTFSSRADTLFVYRLEAFFDKDIEFFRKGKLIHLSRRYHHVVAVDFTWDGKFFEFLFPPRPLWIGDNDYHKSFSTICQINEFWLCPLCKATRLLPPSEQISCDRRLGPYRSKYREVGAQIQRLAWGIKSFDGNAEPINNPVRISDDVGLGNIFLQEFGFEEHTERECDQQRGLGAGGKVDAGMICGRRYREFLAGREILKTIEQNAARAGLRGSSVTKNARMFFKTLNAASELSKL